MRAEQVRSQTQTLPESYQLAVYTFPRSGSMWLALYLSHAGYKVGHEKLERDGWVGWGEEGERPKPWLFKFRGLQVRETRRVISSAFYNRMPNFNYDLETIAQMYVDFHQWALGVADRWWQLENETFWLPTRKIPSPQTNHRCSYDPLSWLELKDRLPHKLYLDVRAMADRLGYHRNETL